MAAGSAMSAKSPRIYEFKKTMTDKDIAAREGTYFDEDAATNIIVDHDADVYGIDDDGKKILLAKFRKGVFSDETTNLAWDAFHRAASASRNRGAAAGPINLKSKYWQQRKPVKIDKWAAQYMQNGKVSHMRVNNNVLSSVLGYFEQTPFMGLPCRLTSYTQQYFKRYIRGIPYLEEVSAQFKRLFPGPFAKQYAAVKATKGYQIGDTAFSSLTINRNFRTALHKDAGDYSQGFGNLTVVERGAYHGGYTLFPQYGVGFDVRSGDFLGMDVHQWHCNTGMYETAEDKKINKALPKMFKKTDAIVQGTDVPYTRISFVCYLREKLESCDPKETKKYYEKIGFNPRNGNRTMKRTVKRVAAVAPSTASQTKKKPRKK
jgi:hypothetical protein